jgi:hypothetical protein
MKRKSHRPVADGSRVLLVTRSAKSASMCPLAVQTRQMHGLTGIDCCQVSRKDSRMDKLLITYDLRKPGRDYATLIEAIKSLGRWGHVLESVWTVEAAYSAATVRDHLKQFVDTNDGLFVCRLGLQEWAAYNIPAPVAEYLQAA